MTDMTEKVFEEQPFGKAALKKIENVTENFRLFHAEWISDGPRNSEMMKVTGAEFRAAKTGPNKGQLSIMVPGTQRMVFVSKTEMQQF